MFEFLILQILFAHVALILTSHQVSYMPLANNFGVKIILNGLFIGLFLLCFDFELISISDELRRILFFGNNAYINYPSKWRLPLDLLLFYLTLIVHSRQTECSVRLDFLWKVQATGTAFTKIIYRLQARSFHLYIHYIVCVYYEAHGLFQTSIDFPEFVPEKNRMPAFFIDSIVPAYFWDNFYCVAVFKLLT